MYNEKMDAKNKEQKMSITDDNLTTFRKEPSTSSALQKSGPLGNLIRGAIKRDKTFDQFIKRAKNGEIIVKSKNVPPVIFNKIDFSSSKDIESLQQIWNKQQSKMNRKKEDPPTPNMLKPELNKINESKEQTINNKTEDRMKEEETKVEDKKTTNPHYVTKEDMEKCIKEGTCSVPDMERYFKTVTSGISAMQESNIEIQERNTADRTEDAKKVNDVISKLSDIHKLLLDNKLKKKDEHFDSAKQPQASTPTLQPVKPVILPVKPENQPVKSESALVETTLLSPTKTVSPSLKPQPANTKFSSDVVNMLQKIIEQTKSKEIKKQGHTLKESFSDKNLQTNTLNTIAEYSTKLLDEETRNSFIKKLTKPKDKEITEPKGVPETEKPQDKKEAPRVKKEREVRDNSEIPSSLELVEIIKKTIAETKKQDVLKPVIKQKPEGKPETIPEETTQLSSKLSSKLVETHKKGNIMYERLFGNRE